MKTGGSCLQQHDILTHDGRNLDGRNRYRACLAAEIFPEFREFREFREFEGVRG